MKYIVIEATKTEEYTQEFDNKEKAIKEVSSTGEEHYRSGSQD